MFVISFHTIIYTQHSGVWRNSIREFGAIPFGSLAAKLTILSVFYCIPYVLLFFFKTFTPRQPLKLSPTFLPCTPRHDMTISIFVILLFRQRLYIPYGWQVVCRLSRRNDRVTYSLFQLLTSIACYLAAFTSHSRTLTETLRIL